MSLVREKYTRNAKDQAVVAIENYFQPTKKLQTIPERAVLVTKPKTIKSSKKDKNNNTDDTKTTTADKNNKKKKKEALHSKSSEVDQKIKKKHRDDDKGDTESTNDAKRTKITDTADVDSSKPNEKNAMHKPQKQQSSLSSNASSDDGIVIWDSSIDSSSASISCSNRAANFNFDALNTDDETDDEDNAPYAPQWSTYKNRIDKVINQEHIDSNVIDKLFGCHAETVDLKAIFPAMKPIARRRSSTLWNTPLRYSSLPKY